MLYRLQVILECSRIYSLPMTILSWLVVFTYGLSLSGNYKLGLLALVGICCAHLATNVLDDYIDYKLLIKQVNFDKKEYLKNTQKTKCRYIMSGMMSPKEVLFIAFGYLFFALIIGLILFVKTGTGVLYFALAGGFIAIFYSLLSRIRLSEIAVALAYGPALFGGVYYVMTNAYSWEIFILSIPSTLITVILLYIHTIMDFDFDLNEGKKTLANFFDSQLDSLVILKWLLISAYLALIPLCIFDILDWQVFFVCLTIPLAIDLYKSLFDFSTSPDSVPEHKWYHFPMENMDRIKKLGAESFMIRMYQSRNLMIYFSLILVIAIILGTN